MNTSRLALACGLALAFLSISVSATERYVSLSGGHVPPFTNWSDAARNIQDAIDAAAESDVIWVTNGVYANGGKVMAGDLTNRVALDKALTVKSVNGPLLTTIQGAGATNGPSAVRCAWLTNGATLMGFTLEAGATRTSGGNALASGGGAWCFSNAIVANCVIRSNTAATYGGGVYQGGVQATRPLSRSENQAGTFAPAQAQCFSDYQRCVLNGTRKGNSYGVKHSDAGPPHGIGREILVVGFNNVFREFSCYAHPSTCRTDRDREPSKKAYASYGALTTVSSTARRTASQVMPSRTQGGLRPRLPFFPDSTSGPVSIAPASHPGHPR